MAALGWLLNLDFAASSGAVVAPVQTGGGGGRKSIVWAVKKYKESLEEELREENDNNHKELRQPAFKPFSKEEIKRLTNLEVAFRSVADSAELLSAIDKLKYLRPPIHKRSDAALLLLLLESL